MAMPDWFARHAWDEPSVYAPDEPRLPDPWEEREEVLDAWEQAHREWWGKMSNRVTEEYRVALGRYQARRFLMGDQHSLVIEPSRDMPADLMTWVPFSGYPWSSRWTDRVPANVTMAAHHFFGWLGRWRAEADRLVAEYAHEVPGVFEATAYP